MSATAQLTMPTRAALGLETLPHIVADNPLSCELARACLLNIPFTIAC
jgi:hypothetical protein